MKNKLLLRGKILAVVSLTVLASTAFSKNTDTRIQIAFSNTQNDKEIATILDSYPVTPTAGFMWVEELSGTHRTYEDLGSEKFIQEPRIQTIIFLKSGLIAHRTHIKKMLDKHLSSFYITESLVAEDKHNLASAWGMEQSAITRIAYLCLDNPIEQFFISKHAILSITKSKGYSYQRAPELNRNVFSVVLQTYGLFAIPLAKIEIKFSDRQFAGCTRL